MSRGHVAERGRQEVDVALDLRSHLGARQRAQPGSSQLQRERQPLDQPADPGHARLLLRKREGRPGLPCPLDKEANSAITCEVAGRALRAGLRVRQTCYVTAPLLLEVQHLSRGRQHLQLRRSGEQGGDQRSRVQQVLEVVEHKEQCLSLRKSWSWAWISRAP